MTGDRRTHHTVAAGPWCADLDGLDLRYLRLAGREVVRRVAFVVRDTSWGTLTPTVTDQQLDVDDDCFVVRSQARYDRDGSDLSATIVATGLTDGTLTYDVDARAQQDFTTNRIGLVLLHPVTLAGLPVQLTTQAGLVDREMPQTVAPQPVGPRGLEGVFEPFSAMTITLADGVRLRHEFDGEIFELEDQRNWADGSFKTYAPPLSRGWPMRLGAAQSFRQRLTIRVEGRPGHSPARVPRIDLPAVQDFRSLPRIGFGVDVAAVGQPGHEVPVGALAAMRPAHLLVDVGPDGLLPEHQPITTVADRAGAKLEVSVVIPAGASLRGFRPPATPVARFIVAPTGGEQPEGLGATDDLAGRLTSTLPQRLQATPVFAGTTGPFASLNRRWPSPDSFDGVAFPVSPQVHASDDDSLFENLDGLVDMVRTAAAVAADSRVAVTPVSLLPPTPDSTGLRVYPHDPRESTLLGCSWTLGAISRLVAAAADSVTFTHVIDKNGGVAPSGLVFADVAGAQRGAPLSSTGGHPLGVSGLALQRADGTRMLLANQRAVSTNVIVTGAPRGSGQIRRLAAGHIEQGIDLGDWEASSGAVALSPRLELELGPYDYIRIDTTS